ncbi:MAG: DegT/DnrJ/EryC1/StrS aminotransferase family protein [Anaerolineales bacterium]|jgi:dTDP-4-amino-4,6-dideoxygalactose transaminase
MRQTFLPFAQPWISEDAIDDVADSLRSGWITTGPKTQRFEKNFRDYLKASHSIAVNSCTAGLHIALTALGVGPGDEVIVPTFTFCSTANVVVHLGARPVLVDVGDDFNVTPEIIERAITSKTKALIPVHFAGQACDLDAIYDLAAKHTLPVIEDAAHAVGAKYDGLMVGSDALASSHNELQRVTVFSFYAIKNLTTGEGGMITACDEDLANRMRLLSLHGMSRDAWKRYTSTGSWYYEVVAPGYKCNMTDIQAAIGIHQLERLDGFISTRKNYAKLYDQAFAEMAEIITPVTYNNRSHAYHLYVIRLDLERLSIDRARFIEELRKLNIGSSVHFIPLHLQPYYQTAFGYGRGDLPNAEKIFDGVISLPLYPKMGKEDVQDVVEAVGSIVSQHRRR